MSPQRWEAHSKTKSTVSGRERRPREQCSIWQEEGSGQQGFHSNHSSFLRQAPSQGPLSPVEVCDSWGSSRRGIPLYPTGEGRHLPLSPYTSSCHVLGHQCFKIYWFLAGCLLKNQKHQVSSSFPQLLLSPLDRAFQYKLLLGDPGPQLTAYSIFPPDECPRASSSIEPKPKVFPPP